MLRGLALLKLFVERALTLRVQQDAEVGGVKNMPYSLTQRVQQDVRDRQCRAIAQFLRHIHVKSLLLELPLLVVFVIEPVVCECSK